MASNFYNFTQSIQIPYDLFINLLLFVLSLFSSIVFAQIMRDKKPNTNMFHYFMIYSMADCMIGFLDVIYYSISWGKKNGLQSMKNAYNDFAYNVFIVYIFYFIGNICFALLSLNQMWATIDCYFSILNKFQFLRTKKAFYIISVVTLIYTAASEVYWALWLKVVKMESKLQPDNSTYYYYGYIYLDINESIGFKIANYIDVSGRCVISISVVVLFNFMILYEMIKSAEKKRKLTKAGSDAAAKNQKRLSPEMRRAIMIMLTGINFFIGQFLQAFYFFASKTAQNQTSENEKETWYIVQSFVFFGFYTAECITHIQFYFFNKLYEEYMNKTLRVLFHPILPLSRSVNCNSDYSDSNFETSTTNQIRRVTRVTY